MFKSPFLLMQVSIEEIFGAATECPSCDRQDFDSEFAVRMHHSRSHGETLPNTKCEDCGKIFYIKTSRKWCSDCFSKEGEKSPSWNGGKEKTDCEACDTIFSYYESEKPGLYCSKCVKEIDWRGNEDHLPEPGSVDKPTWDCEWCGNKIESYKERKFCSLECMGEHKSENIVGENHHNYCGGVVDYGSGWWRARRKQLERDEYQCQICDRGPDDLGKSPDVHHKIPVREFEDPADAHFVENLVTLCRTHHRKVEDGKI